jgi:hypothetical protein
MASSGSTFPWSATATDFDPRSGPMGGFNMNATQMSQSAVHARPNTALVQVCADVKPRLTKDQHEILERHFQAQPKPSTSTKKGFAEALGVPLDKINNWFQNRRAKVKQDAKKQMNAIQLFQATLAQHSQQYLAHPQHMASALPQYYGPLPVVPSNTEAPSEQVPHAMGGPNPHTIPLPPSRDGQSAPLEFAMSAPGMAPTANSMNFNGHHIPTGLAEPPMLFADGFSFDQSFPTDLYNFQFEQQADSNGMPMVMNDASMFPQSSMPTAANSMPMLTSPYTQSSRVEEEKPTFIVDSPQDSAESSFSSSHPTPAESTTTCPSTVPPNDLYEDQKALARGMGLGSESPAPTEAVSESMDSIVIDASASDSESTFARPSQPSGLAARRQKARPANLVPTALRSASYSAGMPGSPGANPSDQLRRIRSHGIANTGRISKVPGPQKSPMHANFDAAALASPKFQTQHASNYSVSTVSSGPLTATTHQGSLAPPTPITPQEFSRFPQWHFAGGKVFHPNGSPGALSQAGDDVSYVGASSPLVPLDPQQFEQLRANMTARHDALFNTPPQSAPAVQQHFGLASTTHGHQMMQPAHRGFAHARRPSLPENHEAESQAQWQPDSLFPAGDNLMQYHAQVPMGFQPEGISMEEAMAMNAACMADANGFPYMNGQMLQKSNLHFHNQGPEDFQNGQRAK